MTSRARFMALLAAVVGLVVLASAWSSVAGASGRKEKAGRSRIVAASAGRWDGTISFTYKQNFTCVFGTPGCPAPGYKATATVSSTLTLGARLPGNHGSSVDAVQAVNGTGSWSSKVSSTPYAPWCLAEGYGEYVGSGPVHWNDGNEDAPAFFEADWDWQGDGYTLGVGAMVDTTYRARTVDATCATIEYPEDRGANEVIRLWGGDGGSDVPDWSGSTMHVTLDSSGRTSGKRTYRDDERSAIWNLTWNLKRTAPAPLPVASVPQFPNIRVGRSDVASVIVTSADRRITITSVTIRQDARGAFDVEADGCTGTKVRVDEICEIDLLATPPSQGTFTATLRITADTGSIDIPLRVRGVAPKPRISPRFIEFGKVAIGTRSKAHTVTLSNAGTAPFSITGTELLTALQIPEPNACWSGDHGVTLGPGKSCTFAVRVAPKGKGEIWGSLGLIYTDVPEEDSFVSLDLRGHWEGVRSGGGGARPVATVDSLTVIPEGVAPLVKGDYTAAVTWKSVAGATFDVAVKAPGSTSWAAVYTGRDTAIRVKVPQGAAKIRVTARKQGYAPGSRTRTIDLAVTDVKGPKNASWTRATVAGSVGKTLLRSTTAGAMATLPTDKAVGYLLVVRAGTEAGTINLLVDGTVEATIDLAALATQNRRIVWSKRYSAPAVRKIQVELVSGQVELDAVMIIH